MVGRLEMLFMVASAIRALGIVTRVPSRVLMRVLRNPIDSTGPSMPSTITLSPTRKGLSAKIAIEPNIFARVSLAARAKARPPTPRPARKPVTLI